MIIGGYKPGRRMTRPAEHVLNKGVQRAIWLLRMGKPLDDVARVLLVAASAAERIDGEDLLDRQARR
jgi:hypothetical protein